MNRNNTKDISQISSPSSLLLPSLTPQTQIPKASLTLRFHALRLIFELKLNCRWTNRTQGYERFAWNSVPLNFLDGLCYLAIHTSLFSLAFTLRRICFAILLTVR